MRTDIPIFVQHRLTLVFFFALLVLMPALALSEETYKFERMWPTLQQPWYFNSTAIAVDGNGNVYIANWNYYTVKKFTSAGQFVTEWAPGDYGGVSLLVWALTGMNLFMWRGPAR